MGKLASSCPTFRGVCGNNGYLHMEILLMEVNLAPSLIDKINRNELRTDWRMLARRLNEDEGNWRLVQVVPEDKGTGAAAHIRRSLREYGCHANVVSLLGIGRGPRPWHGYAIFARVRPMQHEGLNHNHLKWVGDKQPY